ncbi:hypothetical protein TNCV_2051191 [Trichonephila clavipes]|nr:hypothetical protein TNCV_2051191 [Trichonephila clavipes]
MRRTSNRLDDFLRRRAGLKLDNLQWRWVDDYKWLERGFPSVVSFPNNRCYHQGGQSRSKPSINIRTGSLFSFMGMTTYEDNDCSACS